MPVRRLPPTPRSSGSAPRGSAGTANARRTDASAQPAPADLVEGPPPWRSSARKTCSRSSRR
ncbi:hypothetical protein DMB38_22055 [Streptomyces sp. WAC 06738]|nr:hypothetical protein DMB38_22055 [Streptomyces sp. WAC 06738]